MIRLEQVIDALPGDFAAIQAEARAGSVQDITRARKGLACSTRSPQSGHPVRPASLAMARRCIGEAFAGPLIARPETAGRVITTNAAAGSQAF